MLLPILSLSALATLSSALPQNQPPPQATPTGPAPLPPSLGGPAGTPPNFRLIEYSTSEAATQNHWTSCWSTDLSPTPKSSTWQTDMLTCLSAYNAPNWDGQDCGGVGWYKASIKYENPQNCYDACRGCFNWFIDNNSTSGYCWTLHGDVSPNYGGGDPYDVKRKTACKMGYQ